MIELFSDPQVWAALLTLTVLEIVLGIDNIIFISILTGRLPEQDQPRARMIGLVLAMLMRIGLLFSIAWVMSLQNSLFEIFNRGVSGRDIILISGGLFLIAKATHEIHNKLEGENNAGAGKGAVSFNGVLIQIMLLDMVFSLDSVITAVGMADHLSIMVIAVVIAVLIMMIFAGAISRFVESHPTVKMLALSFLLLIGVTLVAEGCHQEIPKGYIYFAMAFSVFVELLNLKVRARHRDPVTLRQKIK